MSIEAYYPDMLSLNKIEINEFKDQIMQINLELGLFDGMLRYVPQKGLVQGYLRAEEVLSAASLEISELSFDQYLDKLWDRGYGADDLTEISFMVDYYKEQDSIVEEKGFSPGLLNDFQGKLLANRKQRIIAETELYRKRQSWLLEASEGFDIRLHIHPSKDRINELMDNLDRFIKKSNLHPLVTAAISYGQLAMIHPWRYCNGRISGALIPYIFNLFDITRERTFYLSAAFAKDKEEYYHQLVKLFKEKDWNGWISYFLQKVKERLERLNQSKTSSILEEYIALSKIFKNTVSAVREVYEEIILNNPILFTTKIRRSYDSIIDTTLYRYLNTLKDEGYMVKDNRRRHMHYILSSLREI